MLKAKVHKLPNIAKQVFNVSTNHVPYVSYLDGLPSKQDIKSVVKQQLEDNGYILIRNSGLKTAQDIVNNNFAYDIFGDGLCDYNGTDGRTKKDLTKYPVLDVDAQPKENFIWFHSEEIYHLTFPKYVMFTCHYPSHTGGYTPIADSYLMYEQLSARYPNMLERFRDEGITYVRNIPHEKNLKYLADAGGFNYKSWQDSFKCETQEEVEEFLTKHGYEFEWRNFQPFDSTREGEALDLRAWINRCPLIECEKTGRMAFSNCFLGVNGYYFDSAPSYKNVALNDRPYHTLWGNKDEIDYNILMDVLNLYYECAVTYPWQSGDIIIADNIWWQHSRTPFEGKRSLSLMLAGVLEWKDRTHVKYVHDYDPLE